MIRSRPCGNSEARSGVRTRQTSPRPKKRRQRSAFPRGNALRCAVLSSVQGHDPRMRASPASVPPEVLRGWLVDESAIRQQRNHADDGRSRRIRPHVIPAVSNGSSCRGACLCPSEILRRPALTFHGSERELIHAHSHSESKNLP
jgi:hypothetical protein